MVGKIANDFECGKMIPRYGVENEIDDDGSDDEMIFCCFPRIAMNHE